MVEKEIPIGEAKEEIWEFVKWVLKIADGESGRIRLMTMKSKDNYVEMRITKLP